VTDAKTSPDSQSTLPARTAETSAPTPFCAPVAPTVGGGGPSGPGGIIASSCRLPFTMRARRRTRADKECAANARNDASTRTRWSASKHRAAYPSSLMTSGHEPTRNAPAPFIANTPDPATWFST
jgi:hypothetical protein